MKVNVNSYINKGSLSGTLAVFSTLIDQPVRRSSDVTFQKIALTDTNYHLNKVDQDLVITTPDTGSRIVFSNAGYATSQGQWSLVGPVTIDNTDNVYGSTTPGALHVKGGVLIDQSLYVGDTLYVNDLNVAQLSTGLYHHPIDFVLDVGIKQNVSSFSVYQARYQQLSGKKTLFATLFVFPDAGSQTCIIDMAVPEKPSFNNKYDVMAAVQNGVHHADNLDIANIVMYAENHRMCLSFTSIDDDLHVFHLMMNY